MQKDLIETRHLNKTAQECDKALSAIVRSSQAETFVYLMTNSKLYLQDSGNQCLANIFFFFSFHRLLLMLDSVSQRRDSSHTYAQSYCSTLQTHFTVSFVFLDKYPQKKKALFFFFTPPFLTIYCAHPPFSFSRRCGCEILSYFTDTVNPL